MPRRALPGTLVAALPLALALLGSPAHADNPPAKTTVYVKKEDMAAAEAARKKSADARALLKAGKLREGAAMLDEALGELERTMGPDGEFASVNRKLLVSVYKQLKQPEKIQAVEARTEANRKKYAGSTSTSTSGNTANVMVKLMASLEALKRGEFAESASILEQALPEVEKSDVSKKQYLLAAGILASLYDHSQQFAKGEALRKEVIAKIEKSFGESSEVGDQYESLATHYMMRADTPKALEAQRRCVDITRKTQPSSAPLVDRLLTLASLQNASDDVKSSEASLSEAAATTKKLKPVDPVRMIRVAHQLARIFDTQLRTAEGDKIAEGACDIANMVKSPEVLQEAEEDCIRAALMKKDTKAAGELAARRFARFEKHMSSTPGLYANAAHELAQVRWAEGKKDEATAVAKKAAEAQEKALARLLEVSGDAQKRAQLSLVSSQAYDLVSMGGNGSAGPAQTRLALETILRRKGRSLDASADAARVVRLFDRPEDKALAQRQLAIRKEIAALGLRGGGGLPGVDPAVMMAKLEAEHDEIGNKLAAASPLYRAQSKPVTIEAVQAAIPDDSALVEYVYYIARDTTSPIFAPKEVRFVAYVLHKTGEPVAVDLGDALPIGRAITKLRAALSERGDVLPHAKQLHDLVVAPIKRHLRPSDQRLIVSPDDDLNLVPFAALVDERGRFLVQDREIAYVTSGRDLLRIAANAAQSTTSAKPLVVGDPAFDDATSGSIMSAGMRSGDLDSARFSPLPGTAVEAKAIGELLGASSLTQGEASKARLTGATGPLVLHVATHGFFLKRERDASGTRGTRALEYDPGEPTTAPPLRSANPLIRSGLALAGANQKTSADGLLTALEASSMNLDGTRLVVLSACETGVGESEVGDGVYGLRRALVVAGAETQVMSLWKVDDEATRDLMIAFYRDLKGGSGRAAALRKVQLAMLAKKQTEHPYFWAAFIPSGNWGPMRFDSEAPAFTPPPAATAAPSTSKPAVDKPTPSKPERPLRTHSLGSSVLVGASYAKTTNLRDQPDREGVLTQIDVAHPLLCDLIGCGGRVGLHDDILLSALGGFRTSTGTTYASGTEEGSFGYGLRAGYEAALGVRGSSMSLFLGGQAMYSTFAVGDMRTYGSTMPLIASLGVSATDSTWIGLRGAYGKWLVDQETVGGWLTVNIDGLVLRGGYEQLKMPTTVSLDGADLRASARRQVTALTSFGIGGAF